MKTWVAAAAALTALVGATVAHAASVPAGKVAVADLYVPAVDFSPAGTFSTGPKGVTFETIGTGGLTGVTGGFGKMSGTLDFSSTIGATEAETISDFFSFADGSGGTYEFSVDSVKTLSLSTSSASNSGSLFLLGTTIDTSGLSATPTSLTLSFNNTGGSPYSSSATLAIPPVGSAPEPSAWILMIAGVGLAGAAFRGSRKVREGQLAA